MLSFRGKRECGVICDMIQAHKMSWLSGLICDTGAQILRFYYSNIIIYGKRECGVICDTGAQDELAQISVLHIILHIIKSQYYTQYYI